MFKNVTQIAVTLLTAGTLFIQLPAEKVEFWNEIPNEPRTMNWQRGPVDDDPEFPAKGRSAYMIPRMIFKIHTTAKKLVHDRDYLRDEAIRIESLISTSSGDEDEALRTIARDKRELELRQQLFEIEKDKFLEQVREGATNGLIEINKYQEENKGKNQKFQKMSERVEDHLQGLLKNSEDFDSLHEYLTQAQIDDRERGSNDRIEQLEKEVEALTRRIDRLMGEIRRLSEVGPPRELLGPGRDVPQHPMPPEDSVLMPGFENGGPPMGREARRGDGRPVRD